MHDIMLNLKLAKRTDLINFNFILDTVSKKTLVRIYQACYNNDSDFYYIHVSYKTETEEQAETVKNYILTSTPGCELIFSTGSDKS
jgi:hypothetical protein